MNQENDLKVIDSFIGNPIHFKDHYKDEKNFRGQRFIPCYFRGKLFFWVNEKNPLQMMTSTEIQKKEPKMAKLKYRNEYHIPSVCVSYRYVENNIKKNFKTDVNISKIIVASALGVDVESLKKYKIKFLSQNGWENNEDDDEDSDYFSESSSSKSTSLSCSSSSHNTNHKEKNDLQKLLYISNLTLQKNDNVREEATKIEIERKNKEKIENQIALNESKQNPVYKVEDYLGKIFSFVPHKDCKTIWWKSPLEKETTKNPIKLTLFPAKYGKNIKCWVAIDDLDPKKYRFFSSELAPEQFFSDHPGVPITVKKELLLKFHRNYYFCLKYPVHRIIFSAASGLPLEYMHDHHVDHIISDAKNNSIQNLQLLTQKDHLVKTNKDNPDRAEKIRNAQTYPIKLQFSPDPDDFIQFDSKAELFKTKMISNKKTLQDYLDSNKISLMTEYFKTGKVQPGMRYFVYKADKTGYLFWDTRPSKHIQELIDKAPEFFQAIHPQTNLPIPNMEINNTMVIKRKNLNFDLYITGEGSGRSVYPRIIVDKKSILVHKILHATLHGADPTKITLHKDDQHVNVTGDMLRYGTLKENAIEAHGKSVKVYKNETDECVAIFSSINEFCQVYCEISPSGFTNLLSNSEMDYPKRISTNKIQGHYMIVSEANFMTKKRKFECLDKSKD